MMQDVLSLDRIDQAETLLKPRRIEILRALAEPRSCPQLAELLGDTPQKVYYHVKRLEEAGLIARVAERRVNGILEGIYQARARAYWLSPQLVGHIGGRPGADHALSLGFLLNLTEELQEDVARLAANGGEVATIGLLADIRLDPERRDAFLRDLQDSVQQLLTTYGGEAGEAFRFAMAVYPKPDAE
jgi:DNA-binding transcriptional ArsR family regulator